VNEKLERALWPFAWLVLAAWTPPMLRPWRRVLLRAFGAKVSPTAGIYGSSRISRPSNLEIGEHAYIGPDVVVDASARVTFGDYSLISQGGCIRAREDGPRAGEGGARSLPIEIGAYAWIAAKAYVGPGVKVGEGAVLGACGCAFEELSPWTVYIGNPAKPLRPRRLRARQTGVSA
jgi:putative colanic acid biosynthesis acetyltransferase WcaF